MAKIKSWVLTDTASNLYVDSWSITSEQLGLTQTPRWSVHKRTLRGGKSDAVDVIEVDNGELSYSIVPTRGMGIWRGNCHGTRLGWDSPVRGPVHPSFVNEEILGGLGWLSGFDEWIVRCGLNSNGAPGVDVMLDNNGNPQEMSLSLHGRIANIPAHYVEVRVNLDPPHGIEVIGHVDESMLFFPQLRLSTVIRSNAGSKELVIDDTITNLRSTPAELQLLYHCNFGPPLLGKGARFLAPVRTVAPRDAVAEQEIEQYAAYPAPTSGVIERVYFFELLAHNETGETLAVLCGAGADQACALRFSTHELPWFTLWKNPGAESDGYVTGLEPATNLPNLKRFEREKGRVVTLPPEGSHHAQLTIELANSAGAVQGLVDEVQSLQAQATPIIHRQRHHDFADDGEPAGDFNLDLEERATEESSR